MSFLQLLDVFLWSHDGRMNDWKPVTILITQFFKTDIVFVFLLVINNGYELLIVDASLSNDAWNYETHKRNISVNQILSESVT